MITVDPMFSVEDSPSIEPLALPPTTPRNIRGGTKYQNGGNAAICSAPRCVRPVRSGARALCKSHMKIEDEGLSMWAENVWIARRLASVIADGECILWTGHKNNMGYGVVGAGHRKDPSKEYAGEMAVHRWFYKRFVGPIPDDIVLDHLCRTPLCVNPKHLEPVTQAENTRRGFISRGYGTDRQKCAHDHDWIPANLARQPNGSFKCKACDREAHRRKNGNNARIHPATRQEVTA